MTLFLLVGFLDELGVVEVLGGAAHAFHDGDGAVGALELNNVVLQPAEAGVLEDGVEAEHAALSEFIEVFDVEHAAASGEFLEPYDGALLCHDAPVDVHLPEHVFGLDVFEHDFGPRGAFDLLVLVRVGVVAVAESGLAAALADGVVVVAESLGFLEVLGHGA